MAGGGLAAVAGIIVGLASLRVRHDFLAITTMGVSFLFVGVVRQQDALGGEMGVSAIPDHGLGKLGFMLLALGIAAAVALFSIYLKRTWMGYAFDAIADDEDTASTVGIDVGDMQDPQQPIDQGKADSDERVDAPLHDALDE